MSPDALETAAPQYVWWVQCLGAALLIAGTGWLYLALGAWEDVEIAEQLARLESAQPKTLSHSLTVSKIAPRRARPIRTTPCCWLSITFPGMSLQQQCAISTA